MLLLLFFHIFYEKPKRKMINDLLKLRFHVLFKKVCSDNLCGILLRGSFIKLIGKIYFLCRCLYFNAGAAVCGSLFLYGGLLCRGVAAHKGVPSHLFSGTNGGFERRSLEKSVVSHRYNILYNITCKNLLRLTVNFVNG